MIRALDDAGYKVLIATDGPQQILLQKEFPHHTFIKLPGYQVRYSKSKGWLPFKIMQQLPALYRIVQWEHGWLQDAIEQYGIDLVISDNRYGLWTKKCLCVFMTHQLTIKAPFAWLETIMQQINYKYINRFDACWVPDNEQDGGLAGILAHPKKLPAIPVSYMGLLSRFTRVASSSKKMTTVLLSGPEPQRTLLEEKIVTQLPMLQQEIVLVRGLPASTTALRVPAHVKAVNHLSAAELEELLSQTKLVIARSGYSSLMDFTQLQLTSILIPTPAQTEQEYLAARCSEKEYAITANQSSFNLKLLIEKAAHQSYHFPEFTFFNTTKLQELLLSLVQKASS